MRNLEQQLIPPLCPICGESGHTFDDPTHPEHHAGPRRVGGWAAAFLMLVGFLAGGWLIGNVRLVDARLDNMRLQAQLRAQVEETRVADARADAIQHGIQSIMTDDEECKATLNNFRQTLADAQTRAAAPNAGSMAQWLPLIRVLARLL